MLLFQLQFLCTRYYRSIVISSFLIHLLIPHDKCLTMTWLFPEKSFLSCVWLKIFHVLKSRKSFLQCSEFIISWNISFFWGLKIFVLSPLLEKLQPTWKTFHEPLFDTNSYLHFWSMQLNANYVANRTFCVSIEEFSHVCEWSANTK